MILSEHGRAKHNVLQGYVKILMEDETTHIGFTRETLQELATISLVDTIGVCGRYVLLD
jgi:hypothetical protein